MRLRPEVSHCCFYPHQACLMAHNPWSSNKSLERPRGKEMEKAGGGGGGQIQDTREWWGLWQMSSYALTKLGSQLIVAIQERSVFL